MRALLKGVTDSPSRHEKEDARVELVSRTGNNKVTVRYGNGRYRAVSPHRLFPVDDRRHKLADEIIDALPWTGAGPDPLDPSSHVPLPRSGERLGEGVAEARASHPHLASPSHVRLGEAERALLGEGEEHEGRSA